MGVEILEKTRIVKKIVNKGSEQVKTSPEFLYFGIKYNFITKQPF